MESFLARELERAIDSTQLDIAARVATECKEVSLDLGLRLVQLVAVQDPDSYDAWALRWLARWLAETPEPTIDQAAEVARALAHIPSDPSAMDAIRLMS
jgi:hypothetical protein